MYGHTQAPSRADDVLYSISQDSIQSPPGLPRPSSSRGAAETPLGIEVGASAAEVKKAHRKWMQQLHPHLLFLNRTQAIRHIDPRLQLRMQPAMKQHRVLSPTEPWESWAVFSYNSVVQGTAVRPHRMYYDCIEGTGVPPGAADNELSHRRICLAESRDGLTWTKPQLGIYQRNGSSANNILLEDSGVSVFFDGSAGADAQWKMACSNAAYASTDGLRWRKLAWRAIDTDDTKPTAQYDPSLGKYVIVVRRDVAPGYTRTIGRCETNNFSDWQSELEPGQAGCPVVFKVDDADPQPLDVYTNAWTPYPSIDEPLAHLYFPSMYAQFIDGQAPASGHNDGLLDIRLLIGDGRWHVGYTDAVNARAPFVSLGVNTCGGGQHAPGVMGGWCSSDSPRLASTSFDTSAAYMASGFIHSSDGQELYFYSSGQPFTHGADGANQSWGTNTGIRLNRVRRDGFVAVEAAYEFQSPPTLLTVDVTVPGTCPPPHTTHGPDKSGCAFEYPNATCPSTTPVLPCQADADCMVLTKHPTCRGQPVSCRADGVCASACQGCEMCLGHTTIVHGGVELHVNLESSVVGFAAIELVQGCKEQGDPSSCEPVPGFELASSDRLRGNAISAVASWLQGGMASLSSLAGQRVAMRVQLADAKLYSLRLACALA